MQSYKEAIAQYGLMRLDGGGARFGGVIAISKQSPIWNFWDCNVMESSVPFLPDMVLPISFTLRTGEERQGSYQRQISLDVQNIFKYRLMTTFPCHPLHCIQLCTQDAGFFSLQYQVHQEKPHQILLLMGQRGGGTFSRIELNTRENPLALPYTHREQDPPPPHNRTGYIHWLLTKVSSYSLRRQIPATRPRIKPKYILRYNTYYSSYHQKQSLISSCRSTFWLVANTVTKAFSTQVHCFGNTLTMMAIKQNLVFAVVIIQSAIKNFKNFICGF